MLTVSRNGMGRRVKSGEKRTRTLQDTRWKVMKAQRRGDKVLEGCVGYKSLSNVAHFSDQLWKFFNIFRRASFLIVNELPL